MSEIDPPQVDGITSSQPKAPVPKKPSSDADLLSRAKFALLAIIAIPYILYMAWGMFLLVVLPDPTGKWEMLIPYGKLSSMIAAAILSMAALYMVLRIGKSVSTDDKVRVGSFFRIALFVVPGLLFSAAVPFTITQEPFLTLYISNPEPGIELVAPLSITYNAETATSILKRRGLSVINYKWDFTGDGVPNDETVVPYSTAFFDRQGGYNVSCILKLSDGSTRNLPLRTVVPNAVFSYSPVIPTIDEPIRFSVAHLIPDDKIEIREVQWDFNNDSIPEETTTELETVHTFLRTGDHTVSVTIVFDNQTQSFFFRTLNVQKPAPQLFPVSITTTPEFLESPSPFQVVFRVSTDEPLVDIKWDFDDESPEEEGERVGHTFKDRRLYQVTARARNENGQVSKVTKVVRVVEELSIADLSFDGSHDVMNNKIVAEAPVAIEITPKTTMPLVDFWWEAPNASQVTSTDTSLKAIYREEGRYNLVMLAKDAEGRVKRLPIVLDVEKKAQQIEFDVTPSQGVAPLMVQFDASDSFIADPNDDINGFIWDFGETEEPDGKIGSARIGHEYTNPGEFTVTLTVSTELGKTASTTKKIVVRAPFLKACFKMSRKEGPVGMGVAFNRTCSTGTAANAIWDFGDGSQSPLLDDTVIHTFGEPGDAPKEYKVKLILEDINGTTDTYETTINTQ
jgi:PKD repeat protein